MLLQEEDVPRAENRNDLVLGLFSIGIAALLLLLGIVLLVLSFPTPWISWMVIGFGGFFVLLGLIGFIRYMGGTQSSEFYVWDEENMSAYGLSRIEPLTFEEAKLRRFAENVWVEPYQDRSGAELAEQDWGRCESCGAVITVSDSKYCSNCGLRLGEPQVRFPATEPRAKKVQVASSKMAGRLAHVHRTRAGEPLGKCIVCNLSLKPGDSVAWCPHCGNAAHRIHLLEWIHIRDRCPTCGEHLNETELTRQITQRYRPKSGPRDKRIQRTKKKATRGREGLAA